MNSIDVYNLLKLNNPIIIDIRCKYDYNKGNIPNSINIPYYQLERNYKYYLNNIDTYYIYCYYGEIGEKICKELSPKDYNLININGGYNSYLKKITS